MNATLPENFNIMDYEGNDDVMNIIKKFTAQNYNN